MREQWARNIAISTGVLVVLLAILFARMQNPLVPTDGAVGEAITEQPTSAVLPKADGREQAVISAGRSVFEANNCMGCHSIAGEGNPRYPLDGVGNRHTGKAIRQWILAPAELKDQIPAGAFQVKQAYRNLPSEDVEALVAYLQSV
jgi:mono/diheme cytochrome c family protein